MIDLSGRGSFLRIIRSLKIPRLFRGSETHVSVQLVVYIGSEIKLISRILRGVERFDTSFLVDMIYIEMAPHSDDHHICLASTRLRKKQETS